MSVRNETCPVNRCGRPFGIGTHMRLTGHGRASDQTFQVCEEHWQAVREIIPLPDQPVMPAKNEATR
jgi:hypothetical protein